MSHRMRTPVMLALVAGLLVPAALAQKAPAPVAPPSAPPISRPPSPTPSGPDQTQPMDSLVMFLRGRIATEDGTSLPNDVVVERVCNNMVRQAVYASSLGDFTMQLGSLNNSVLEASSDQTAQYGASTKDTSMGIPRRDLATCELRISASGFYTADVSLMELTAMASSNVDVGSISVQRRTKIKGATVSAVPYNVPKDAKRAYDKGLDAEKNGKLPDAREYFQTAVQIYPRYEYAWFQLGTILQKQNDKDAATRAFTRATAIDSRFLPPYLSLASMAFEAENWIEVLNLTGHIMDLDPLNNLAGYAVDLDRFNYADAYFYNAVANLKLNKLQDAEKSGLKAEHFDLRTHFPQLHLLLAEISARKSDYATAISEVQTYLALAPHAKDADQVREQLAKLEKLNGSLPTTPKSNPQ